MSEFDIKGLRKEIGLTQKELAEKMGIAPRTVQMWEAGGTIPESKKKLLESLLHEKGEIISSFTNGDHSSQAVGDGATATNSEGVKECLEIIKQQQEMMKSQAETIKNQSDAITRLIERLSN